MDNYTDDAEKLKMLISSYRGNKSRELPFDSRYSRIEQEVRPFGVFDNIPNDSHTRALSDPQTNDITRRLMIEEIARDPKVRMATGMNLDATEKALNMASEHKMGVRVDKEKFNRLFGNPSSNTPVSSVRGEILDTIADVGSKSNLGSMLRKAGKLSIPIIGPAIGASLAAYSGDSMAQGAAESLVPDFMYSEGLNKGEDEIMMRLREEELRRAANK